MQDRTIAMRVRRAALGLSQTEAGKLAGLTLHRYHRIERGTFDPTPDEEKAIAKALKCKRADLFPEVAEACK
jgi:DNA-binding XRE family transcriptional regulator